MKETIRTHRVGAVTTGLSMVVFGILFILHWSFALISYEMIFQLWPFILISLGIEILISNFYVKAYIYDKAAIALLILVTFFVMCMAGADLCFSYLGAEIAQW